MTIKMQPGDWIAREDIRNAKHLDRIRAALRRMGYRVHERHGEWNRMHLFSGPLVLDQLGDFCWDGQDATTKGTRINPHDLLSEGHPAAEMLRELADEAERNPRPWEAFQWRYISTDQWKNCDSLTDCIHALEVYELRRKPRTLTRYLPDGTTVELPEPKYANTQEVLSLIPAEISRARRKFPDPGGSMTALTEEVGELAKALLSEPRDRVTKEAVQVAAMAVRIATEGDPTLDSYRLAIEADSWQAEVDDD